MLNMDHRCISVRVQSKKMVCHSLLAGPTLISHECMKLDSVCEQEYHASVLRVDMWMFHWYCWIIQFFAESVVT